MPYCPIMGKLFIYLFLLLRTRKKVKFQFSKEEGTARLKSVNG